MRRVRVKRKRHEVSLSRPFLHADPLLLSLLALRYSLCPLLYLHSWPKAGAAPYSRVPRNERSKRQGIGWKKRPPPFVTHVQPSLLWFARCLRSFLTPIATPRFAVSSLVAAGLRLGTEPARRSFTPSRFTRRRRPEGNVKRSLRSLPPTACMERVK